MVRKIARMLLKYVFHVALRISNKWDWILDADNLTLKNHRQVCGHGIGENVLEQTTPRVNHLHMTPRIARRCFGAFQHSFEGLDRVFERGELLRRTLMTCSEKYGAKREYEEDVARGGAGDEGESPEYDGGRYGVTHDGEDEEVSEDFLGLKLGKDRIPPLFKANIAALWSPAV
jgi:hypothetical protein